MQRRPNVPRDPTPKQIREMCQEIRKRWNEAEAMRRLSILKPVPWMPPTIDSVDMRYFDESSYN